MKWLLFLDLDGTFWDHLNVSGTKMPFERVSQYTIRDMNGETLTIKPGVLDFIEWAKRSGGIVSSCTWNYPEMALSALMALDVDRIFDYQEITPEGRKDLLMLDLLEKLDKSGLEIPEENLFYLDDRDIHMENIRRRFPKLNFLHMWKVVKGFPEAREIISRSLGIK